MKKNRPSPPTSRSKEKEQEQARTPSPQPEPLYAQVNKPRREQHAQTVEETIYAPQNPPETIYAPQKPVGNPYDRLGGRPSNGRRAEKLVDPYAVTDLDDLERGPDYQEQANPLYEGVDRGAHGGLHPQEPEHLYAELEFDIQGGRSPQKPVESVYATVGIGAEGGQDPQQRENPLYEGVGSGKTTPPPRSPKDEVTSKLLKHRDFQYGVREVQERCRVVYGNQYALNEKLAAVLDDPEGADKILWKLAANPETGGKLAGQKLLGVKSPGRREAEEEFRHLCAAFERHVAVTQKLHKDFTREQEKQREHERETNPERQEHRHHHRHHSQEREQGAPEQEAQRKQSPKTQKGMAFGI
ncbi:BepD protein [Bartonella henselae]|uniref:BID domain-containing T4SS effector n=1 Tax=Bartonella henselae TaxID=38323 RepID=UPI00095F5DE2|nr:BID domain-containing T4SS effector [Bartonella henselae]OLL53151.1 BepD protein [Bartonella henselae]